MTICKICKEPTENVAYCNECIYQVRTFIDDSIEEIANWMPTDEKTALEIANIVMLEKTREEKWRSY